MSRGGLFIRVEHAGRELDLITAHFKSKLLAFSGPCGPRFYTQDEHERARAAAQAQMLRASEAATVRMHVSGLLSEGRSLIVLGDLNDTPDAATSQLLEGPSGTELGSAAFMRGDRHNEMRLFNLAARMEEPLRYSRVHNGRRELVDQILASASLFPREGTRRRRLPFRVWCELDPRDDLASIADDPTYRRLTVKPDHAPVLATLKI